MNHLLFDKLTINGTTRNIAETISFCNNSDESNLKLMGAFLSEWFNDSPEMALQTSGSTGQPKIIRVQKSQMLQSAAMTAKFFQFKPGQTALLALPLTYIAGKMMVVRALLSGLNLFCIEPIHHPLNQIPSSVTIDFAPLVPMQLDEATYTATVRTILLGGAPLTGLQEEKINQLNAAVFHGYGMTETLSHVAIRSVNGKSASPVYHALPNIFFEVDERNCLIVNAPFVTGKIYTNDVVDVMDERSFVWKGRIDNVINSGGVKLFPESIESRISAFVSHPFFVAAVPDEHLGEALCLVIESPKFDAVASERLKTLLHENLSRFEHPKHIFFVEQFYRTESGKVQRNKVIEALLQQP